MFVDVLDGQKAFLDQNKYRPYYIVDKLVFCKEADTRKLKKNGIFPKGLTHDLGHKNHSLSSG